jgi:chromosome segregation ATPase
MTNQKLTRGSSTAYGKEVLRAIARRAGTPVWNRLRPRMETIAAQRSAAVAQELHAEIANLRAELRGDLADLRAAMDTTRNLTDQVEWTQSRIAPQVAALDERVGQLEQPATALTGTKEEEVEARTLVDEIRTEHARVRARLSAVASYEHRIAKVEQTLTALTGNTN